MNWRVPLPPFFRPRLRRQSPHSRSSQQANNRNQRLSNHLQLPLLTGDHNRLWHRRAGGGAGMRRERHQPSPRDHKLGRHPGRQRLGVDHRMRARRGLHPPRHKLTQLATKHTRQLSRNFPAGDRQHYTVRSAGDRQQTSSTYTEGSPTGGSRRTSCTCPKRV